ncbi:hypothetical protein FC65_GL001971 [Ligilactobacillus acidipiscis DSM 15836]|uniref:Uncharacterized protein n=2 Tax=Ligilactobacillus acidipiscis TaxID=89059 RepID=A0A0R2KCM4_9LACO|nr:hypothetical protein [Ligilactobacillus acidipiscis]KRM31408.1 hypothetical protein FC65_GL001971 [Ligilactobacillus acidipiscis DSM 15836]KRN87216.1 hypothetical protein IV43_GL001752 [Ligilactobacillus acidipiscis]GAW63140.1 hypothetical protein Lacidipiscis_00322 [Ligilactobacillus acidipiscis]SFV39953.1 hypothetical protein LAC1533_0533 [Ligilactobacillus acidipiscis]
MVHKRNKHTYHLVLAVLLGGVFLVGQSRDKVHAKPVPSANINDLPISDKQ